MFIDTIESLVPADTDALVRHLRDARAGRRRCCRPARPAATAPSSPRSGARRRTARTSTSRPSSSSSRDDTDANQDVYDAFGRDHDAGLDRARRAATGTSRRAIRGARPTARASSSATAESLVATDTRRDARHLRALRGRHDAGVDRPDSLNAELPVTYDGASADGSRVFFETAEPLVATDTDTVQDVYSSSASGLYARPEGRLAVARAAGAGLSAVHRAEQLARRSARVRRRASPRPRPRAS